MLKLEEFCINLKKIERNLLLLRGENEAGEIFILKVQLDNSLSLHYFENLERKKR